MTNDDPRPSLPPEFVTEMERAERWAKVVGGIDITVVPQYIGSMEASHRIREDIRCEWTNAPVQYESRRMWWEYEGRPRLVGWLHRLATRLPWWPLFRA